MPTRHLPRAGYQPRLYFRGSLCLICLSTFSVQAQEYASLPDAPRAAPVVTDAMFYLSIVVNGQTDNQVVPVTYRNNAYFVEAGVLAKNHVRINGQQGLINVGELPGVNARYDAGTQQLILQVPDAWLPNQNVSGDPLMNYTPSQSSTGLLFNYDAYFTDPPDGGKTIATWMEQRFFSNLGIISNTGTYRYNIDSINTGTGNDSAKEGYLRYDTFWRFTDEKNLISYQVGDFVSNSLTWSNSARMGGLRVSRNFGVRPDLVTYPLLQYSGTAAVPTTVDLFLNGYKASSNNLNSGPFTLTNVPYINGAGEATIVTTDAVGRQISTSVPFYVSNTLLRKNLSDFDASLGAVRKNYGLTNGDYSDAAFSGIYRYGLANYLTLSGHTEVTQGLTLGGLGADVAVGTWGTLSLSGSQSKADHSPVDSSNQLINQTVPPNGSPPGVPDAGEQNADLPGISMTDKKDGTQYTVGYSYYSTLFSLSALRSKRTVGYQDLTSYTSDTRLSRQADQVTFSTSPFGSSNGTMGIGYYDVEAYDNSHTRLVNFSYSRSLWGQSSMFLSLNKTLGDSGYSAQLQFIIPLSTSINMNAGVQRDSAGNYQEQIGASKATPTEGGLGWNLAYSGGNNPYQQADATWKSRFATVQGGFYGNQGDYTNWADLSGSVVFMANDWFLSDKINDAFIVVDTDHYAGVPVLFENQKMGKTDSKGHLLIPSVSSFYPAKVEIDTLPLPADVVANNVNDRISVKQGSGMVVKFNVEKVLSANITLHDARGQPVKLGTLVTEQNTQQTTVAGYDGLVYFSHLKEHNVLSIQQEDHSVCRVSFDLNPAHHSIEQIGPLVCAGMAGEKS